MLALQITELKHFMGALLGSELFDPFLLSKARIDANATFSIDGCLNADFYTEEEQQEQDFTPGSPLPYALLRPICYQLIRGKHTPCGFQFVFMLSPAQLHNLLKDSASKFHPNDIAGVFLNLNYKNNRLLATTGISYQTFSLNHTLEEEWDRFVRNFLTKHGISFEEF